MMDTVGHIYKDRIAPVSKHASCNLYLYGNTVLKLGSKKSMVAQAASRKLQPCAQTHTTYKFQGTQLYGYRFLIPKQSNQQEDRGRPLR